MYTIETPSYLERLRHISHVRGAFVKRDSEMGGYKVTSAAGDISWGHEDALAAYEDFIREENLSIERGLNSNGRFVDLPFLKDATELSPVSLNQVIEISGSKYIVVEVKSPSGLIEGPSTQVVLEDGSGVSSQFTADTLLECVRPAIPSSPMQKSKPAISISQMAFSF